MPPADVIDRVSMELLKNRILKPTEVSMIDNVGMTAGKVYKKLDVKGQMSLTRLKREVGGNDTMVTMAVGWLAREGKLNFAKERNVLKIELAN